MDGWWKGGGPLSTCLVAAHGRRRVGHSIHCTSAFHEEIAAAGAEGVPKRLPSDAEILDGRGKMLTVDGWSALPSRAFALIA